MGGAAGLTGHREEEVLPGLGEGSTWRLREGQPAAPSTVLERPAVCRRLCPPPSPRQMCSELCLDDSRLVPKNIGRMKARGTGLIGVHLEPPLSLLLATLPPAACTSQPAGPQPQGCPGQVGNVPPWTACPHTHPQAGPPAGSTHTGHVTAPSPLTHPEGQLNVDMTRGTPEISEGRCVSPPSPPPPALATGLF